jgi:hypothetical protein
LRTIEKINHPAFGALLIALLERTLSSQQLKSLTQSLATVTALKAFKDPILFYEFGYFNWNSMSNHKVFLTILKNKKLLYQWLHSHNKEKDLENIFHLHLPSQTDWDSQFLHKYFHEFL